MHLFLRSRVTLLALAFVMVPVGFGQEKRAAVAPAFPTNEQMRHYRTMGNPRLSPDGQKVLLQVADSTADGGKSHLWLVDVGVGAARQLTYSPKEDKRGERSGDWMPDGKSVLFLAKRGEHTELYRLPMDGGEAKGYELKVPVLVDESKLPGALPPASAVESKEKKAGEKTEPVGDELAIDVVNYRISPDGKTIAVMASDPETPGEKKDKDAKADADWVDHEMHRSRLYLMSADLKEGEKQKLTVVEIPADVRGADWSADSTKLVVDAEAPNGVDELGPAGSTWVVMAKDLAHPQKVAEIPATAGAAVWSHDGNEIVYEAQAKRDAPPGYGDLYELSLATKKTRNLTDGFEGSIGRMEPLALADGGVLEAAEVGVDVELMRYTVSGKAEVVKMPFAALAAANTNDSQSGWVFAGSSGGKAPELVYAAKLGDAPKVLQTPELMPKDVRSVAPKRIEWKNEGQTIEGLLYLPPQAAEGKVPLVVDVHGGPLGADVDNFEPLIDFVVGQGWAVLRTNPRGSSGRCCGRILEEVRGGARSLRRRITMIWAAGTTGTSWRAWMM
jgi:dipeptidyl aminopeptidase/acylaminoacyl peptidase